MIEMKVFNNKKGLHIWNSPNHVFIELAEEHRYQVSFYALGGAGMPKKVSPRQIAEMLISEGGSGQNAIDLLTSLGWIDVNRELETLKEEISTARKKKLG